MDVCIRDVDYVVGGGCVVVVEFDYWYCDLFGIVVEYFFVWFFGYDDFDFYFVVFYCVWNG